MSTRPIDHETGSSNLRQLFRERRTRGVIYGASSYWDARARARQGMARSMWPSNAFNELWDSRQRTLLDRALGDLRDRTLVDIGCGTGRMTRWLAGERGAKLVVGVDFSPATVAAACDETRELVEAGRVRFVAGDVLAGLDDVGVAAFDDAMVLGCLSVACRERVLLDRALESVARLVRPGGRVVLLEPIHRSPLLRRVLDLGVEDWIASANRVGLALTGADRMGFVPGRLFLSVRDWPRALLAPCFRSGEWLLDHAPWLAPLSDYKLLVFERTT
jgi:SAM-dependent methyltransferase